MEDKTQTKVQHWLVVFSTVTGEFKNTSFFADVGQDAESISLIFEENNPEYRVIHIGEGELPPKTYRSLKYIECSI